MNLFAPRPRALTLALLLCAPFAQAQDAKPTPPERLPASAIPRLQGDIVIDGKLDDAAWQGALEQSIDFDIQPGDNTPAEAKTKVRIGYTDDALYVSFHAMDPDPSAVRANLRDRDSMFSDDWVGVFLDTFNDKRRGYELVVNPLGVQGDLIRDETNTSNQEDESWDGLWTSAGQLTAEGYDVEIRIPFSTLRFPTGGQDQRWGISFFRSWPRDKRHQLTSHRVPRESTCFQCEWLEYTGMAGVKQGRNLEVVPTLTMGATQSRPQAATKWGDTDSSIEPGVDVSWAPSPAMTLNATLNPDFSQVETDQLQLDFNSSFALFYQEKRPFFLEGADYFTTQFDVLYTRQIADPDFGLRVTGRTPHSAYGALAARDASTLLLVPGVQGSSFVDLDQKANVAVGRYRYDFNDELSIGAIGTFRHGDDYANDVVGADGRWHKDAHTVTAQFLHSQSEYPQWVADEYGDELGHDASPTGNAWRAGYSFGNRNWNFDANHAEIDPGFRADLGFIGQVGYDKSLVGGQHTWYRDGKSIHRWSLYGDYDITHRYDGQLLERELEFQLNFQGAKQSSFGISPLVRERFWKGQLFDEHNLNLYGNFRPTGRLQLGTYMNFGRQLDLIASRTGHREMIGIWGNSAIGRGINLEWEASRQRLHRDGGTAFDASVADVRMGWQFSPEQRLRLTLQGSEVLRDQALYSTPVNETAREWAGQVVYSYKLNPRTALYAGASYGAFMDDDNLELFGSTRSVFLKLSYGWQP
ncbi:MAG TPA: DUF5916 domain-containing protein [Thermomonas sp.]|nr:DUF5916 domain-containing protein [Thermomonas sp.]